MFVTLSVAFVLCYHIMFCVSFLDFVHLVLGVVIVGSLAVFLYPVFNS